MKWQRALFGLWLLSSVLWAAAVVVIAVRTERARPLTTSVRVEFSYIETWDFPVEWGEKRIRAALEERIAVLNAEERKWVAEMPEDRKAVCRNWFKSTSVTPFPADCE